MESRNIILYSTECTRCKIIKRMLDVHNVPYTEINDKQMMLEKEFESAPVLEVDGKVMEYSAILTWMRQNNYYSLWGDDEDECN